MNNISLTDAEKEEIKRAVDGMSPEELREVAKALPLALMLDEVKARCEDHINTLNNISNYFKIGEINFR